MPKAQSPMPKAQMARVAAAFGVCVAALIQASPAAAAVPCESLSTLTLPDTQITSAAIVPAGSFTPPQANAPIGEVPEFCRVTATLTPSPDSDIKIEVWLPDPLQWNSKFQAVGNGGWAGVISYGALAASVGHGFATASTDTGHVGNTASFAIG